jgi:hypothetical protein
MDIDIGPDGKLGLSPGSNITAIFWNPDLLFELEKERCRRNIWSFPRRCRRFHRILTRTGLKFMPAGVYEDQGCLVVSFEECFLPEIPADKSARDQ